MKIKQIVYLSKFILSEINKVKKKVTHKYIYNKKQIELLRFGF